jgi:hypothetical protein
VDGDILSQRAFPTWMTMFRGNMDVIWYYYEVVLSTQRPCIWDKKINIPAVLLRSYDCFAAVEQLHKMVAKGVSFRIATVLQRVCDFQNPEIKNISRTSI